jgi:serine/threonine protein kinase/class 3 adenylate cyclase/dienelactone hydrolase
MNPQSALEHRERVAEFQRRHRIGLVTLLFSDIVGSTRLKQELGDRDGVALIQRHHTLVRETLAGFKEAEAISTAGDSFFLVFAKPSDAVKFSLLLQARLTALSRETSHPLRDRIGIHVGEVFIEEVEGSAKPKDLYGIQVDTCARVMSLAKGSRILMTRFAFDNARQVLKGQELPGLKDLRWLNHGPYRLQGVEEPLEICEVGEAGAGPLTPPASSEKAERYLGADSEPVLGWRPALDMMVPGTEWVLEQKLGEGGFGEVWLGRHKQLKDRRVFKFCFRADRVRSLKREVTLFRLLKERVGEHPNIVSLREVFFDEPPYYIEMDYVAGKDLKAWCADQGGAGTVPLAARLEIAAQVADALQAAHSAGVIHRDVKPGNILVRGDGSGASAEPESGARSAADSLLAARRSPLTAKLTDFGIGQVVSRECLAGMTRAGFTQTLVSPGSSSQTGTHLYMAPELLAGSAASPQSDIYSLGVVLYQLLVGDLHRPLTTDWPRAIDDALLREDLTRCFAGRPEERFANAGLLAKSLREIEPRRAAAANQHAAIAARQRVLQRWRILRSAAVAALVLALGASLIWFLRHNAKLRWARETALPEITRLAKQGQSAAAFALAREAEKYIPTDPALTNLWPQISVRTTIESTPDGADVLLRDYRALDAPWQQLGKTPLRGVRLASGFYRWQIKKDGYALIERADWAPDGTNRFSLDSVSTLPPGMVRVDGGKTDFQLNGLGHLDEALLYDYFIDRFEVTNREFKTFVDGGGYESARYWKLPFTTDAGVLSWQDAMALFRDSTGRPGPATWKNGAYPEGEADHPVAGVSWYEAAAYAEFAGKRLPSIYHWNRAASLWSLQLIVPLSNFDARGPARVGAFQGMSAWGAFDMAGNVKEWCWNAAGHGQRYMLGGATGEPDYMFATPDPLPPLDRRPSHGFRCIKLLSTNSLAAGVDDFVVRSSRDYSKEKPVRDEMFRIYRSLFAYDKTPLEARIESVVDASPLWRKEKISFNAAYGNERMGALMFLPKQRPAPWQAVVYFPGIGVVWQRSSESLFFYDLERINLIVESGRAVIFPIYKSTYERGDSLTRGFPTPTVFYRDHVIMWSKDLGRALDYLETRQDLLHGQVAYLGLSWGAALGALLPALESRFKASVLMGGGFHVQSTWPEADQLNFAPRISTPTLMLNGRYDFIFPVESCQRPMFDQLGVAAEHKRHVVHDSGHIPPSHQIAKEMLDWLDRYLGPVK